MLVVFGAGGQVGRAVGALAKDRGTACRCLTREEADLRSESDIEASLDGATFVVNCAAYTNVDLAESEETEAVRVNAEAPGTMARFCRRQGIPFLHLSTDYVFDGLAEHPIPEDQPATPLSAYGRSKAMGEAAVRDNAADHLILRVSGVFSPHGRNFVRTIFRLAHERDELGVVSDQVFGPTEASDIASAIFSMIATSGRPGFSDWGTYHYCGAPQTTWYSLAQDIVRLSKAPARVVPISAAEYGSPASRPAYSVLGCTRIHDVFGIVQPDWRSGLARTIDLLAKGAVSS